MAQRLASNFVKMARAVGSVDASTTVFLCCDIQERFRPIIRDFDKVVTASSMLMKGAQALRCPVIVTEQYPKGLGKTVEELVLHEGVDVFEKTAFSMMIEPVRHKIQSYGLCSALIFYPGTTSPFLSHSALRCSCSIFLCSSFCKPNHYNFCRIQIRCSFWNRGPCMRFANGTRFVAAGERIFVELCEPRNRLLESANVLFLASPFLTVSLLPQGVDVHLPVDAISSTHWEDRRIALERLSQCGAFLTTTESILFQLAKDARNSSFKVFHVACSFDSKSSEYLQVISALAKEPRVRIRDNGSSE